MYAALEESNARALRLLGIYAHPDDETFCAGGTLAKYTSAGAEAMVVSLTRGEAGQIREAALATRRTLGARRARELEAACSRLGVRYVRCYDYGDGRLRDLPAEVLMRPVVQAIREFRPDVVLTFDESGAYGHPDHIAVSQITGAACQAAGDPAQFAEQLQAGLAPHTPCCLYHSCFPRNGHLLLELLIDWLRGLDHHFRGSDEFVYALMLFADEASMLGYCCDRVQTQWYPKGFRIIEQGEPVSSVYLVASGSVDVLAEDAAGNLSHVETLGPGQFAGLSDVNRDRVQDAHVVAAENATCFVLLPGQPAPFAGRGEDARFGVVASDGPAARDPLPTVCVDVGDFVDEKVAAICEHRTQYALRPEVFPRSVLVELLHKEYFRQVLPARAADGLGMPHSQVALSSIA